MRRTMKKKISLCNSGVLAGDSKTIFNLTKKVNNNNAAKEFYLTDIVTLARQNQIKTEFVKCKEHEAVGVNTKKQLAQSEKRFQKQMRKKFLKAGVTLRDPKTVFFSFDTRIDCNTEIEQNVIFGTNVEIKGNSKILPFCHLEGCTIGKGAKVGPYTRIRPKTVIEAGVKVGNFVELKNSNLDLDSKVNHLSYVGDASIGTNTNIGAGTIFCNYDGVSKYHTDIGKNSFVGSNSSLVAPLTIGNDTYIASGSVITQNVNKGDLSFGRSRQVNKQGMAKKLKKKIHAFKPRK